MIEKDKVVSLVYSLKNDAGEELDRGDRNDPFAYLHGHNQIVPGLENELLGMTKGQSKKITVAAKDGYGEFDATLLFQVNRGQFPPGAKLQEGLQFQSSHEGRAIIFTVEKIEGDAVTVNGNHPLAGQTLHFEVEVLDIRDATEEEISHGHAHGPSGHHVH